MALPDDQVPDAVPPIPEGAAPPAAPPTRNKGGRPPWTAEQRARYQHRLDTEPGFCRQGGAKPLTREEWDEHRKERRERQRLIAEDRFERKRQEAGLAPVPSPKAERRARKDAQGAPDPVLTADGAPAGRIAGQANPKFDNWSIGSTVEWLRQFKRPQEMFTRWKRRFDREEMAKWQHREAEWQAGDEWIPIFLTTLEATGDKWTAIDQAHVTIPVVQDRMKTNFDFKRAVREAMRRYKDMFKLETVRRAIDGEPYYATYMGKRGELIGYKKDADLLKLLAQAYHPVLRPNLGPQAPATTVQVIGAELRSFLQIDEAGHPASAPLALTDQTSGTDADS